MIRRMVFAFIGAVLGYVSGACMGYFVIQGFSSNMHDRPVEAVMTGAFLTGPLVAVMAFIIGFILGGRKKAGNNGENIK